MFRLLFNGKIHTLEDTTPQVSAILIDGDRIIATGNDDLRQQYDNVKEKVDLGGKVVVPGMIDSHAHLQLYTESMHSVNLMDTRSLEEALERVRVYAEKNRTAKWIEGWGWRQDDWADKKFPTAAMLDRIVSDVPVTLTARSGHCTWSNHLALSLANITCLTPDPVGGEVQRDEAGEPTGILLDEAVRLVEEIIPPLTIDELADKMEDSLNYMNALGLTGIHDFDGAESFRALQVLNGQGKLTMRVTKNILVKYMEDAIDMGLRSGFGDDFLRIGAIKIFADGALGSRTGATFEPYEGEPSNRGLVVTGKEDMVQLAGKATLAGLNCAIHAIGDRAVHDVLDAYELVRAMEKENGIAIRDRRHRMEHVQLIHPEDAGRLGKLDIVAAMQPIHATSDMHMADLHWGRRAAYGYNWRLQLDAGATVAFGSDAPVESPNPFLGIHAAVTRRRADGSPGPDGWRPENNGRLTVQEAIHAYTVGSAYAAGLEHKLGRLKAGFLADLLVLDQDPFAVEPMEIQHTRPVGVMLGGEWFVREM